MPWLKRNSHWAIPEIQVFGYRYFPTTRIPITIFYSPKYRFLNFFFFLFFPHLLYLKIICLPGSKTIDTLSSLYQSLFLTWSLTLFCWTQDLNLGSLTKDTVCTHNFLLSAVLNSTPGPKLFLHLSLHQEPSERKEK